MEDPLKPPPVVLLPFPLCLPELVQSLPDLWGELRLRPPVQGLQVLAADRSVPLLPVPIPFEVHPLEPQGLAPLPGLAAND